MRFGVGYWSAAATRLRPRHHALLYDELCAEAKLAESLGYADYWIVEHHFWYDGHANAQLTVLGALAAETERIGLGTSVLILPLHDPLRIAEMAGTVDRLSGGRLRLAFGIGYREEEYDGFGISRRRRPARMEDGLAFLRQAWGSAGPFEFAGREIRYHAPVEPLPSPRRPPRLYVGALVPQAVERAARYGCGLQLGAIMTAEQAGQLVALYHAAGERAGVDTSQAEIGIDRDFWIAPTTDEARRVARPRLYNYYGETVALGWRQFRDTEGAVIGADRAQVLGPIIKGAVDAAIVGDPDHVTEEIDALRAAGFNYVQLRYRFDSLGFEQVKDAMTLFAEQVMPRF
jgi:alkanesulfonate monooxygenase SsuD/methylene tetrahydromethanopterin reductase-like flavin-dependent oxidoreductase (luciferase family)